MNLKILGLVIVASALGAFAVSHLVGAILPTPCTWKQVLAVGGCDSAGVCGVVVVTQQGQVSKALVSHPVAGFPECIP